MDNKRRATKKVSARRAREGGAAANQRGNGTEFYS